jgi:hypothetical protein
MGQELAAEPLDLFLIPLYHPLHLLRVEPGLAALTFTVKQDDRMFAFALAVGPLSVAITFRQLEHNSCNFNSSITARRWCNWQRR